MALVAHIQFLEAQNNALRQQLSHTRKGFRIEQIANDDSLVSLYTGFPTYEVLLSFLEFLGPAAHNLHYHGSARDNVRSSDNFRPIYACDRLCAIMVGQNVQARDNARIINYIAYWPAVHTACADNYFTLGAWLARIQQHYSYLGPGYWA